MEERNTGSTGTPETPDRPSGPSSASLGEFERFLVGFAEYFAIVAAGDARRVRDSGSRPVADVYAATAAAIATRIRDDFSSYYQSAGSRSKRRLDVATSRLGGVTAVEGVLSVAESEAAEDEDTWDRINEISEAVKKILRHILDFEVFGMSIDDFLGVVFDIDEALEILDNILRELKKLAGKDDVARKMFETEREVTIIAGERRRTKGALLELLVEATDED